MSKVAHTFVTLSQSLHQIDYVKDTDLQPSLAQARASTNTSDIELQKQHGDSEYQPTIGG